MYYDIIYIFNRIIIGGSVSYNCIRLRCWSRIHCDVWRRNNVRIDNRFDHKAFHEKVISKRGQQWLLLFALITGTVMKLKSNYGGITMEIKLNRFERLLMKLGNLLFSASSKVKEIVYKRYDKDLRYRSRSYCPNSGILVLKEMRRKES